MRTSFLLALLATTAFALPPIPPQVNPYRAEESASFDSILRRAQNKYPDCWKDVQTIGERVVPLGQVVTPGQTPSRHFVFRIQNDKREPRGELTILARKHHALKALTLIGCEARAL